MNRLSAFWNDELFGMDENFRKDGFKIEKIMVN